MVLERLQRYIVGGHAALGQYDDGRSPLTLQAAFASVLAQSPCLTDHLTPLAAALAAHPPSDLSSLESFFYWSDEEFGSRPVVSATHVVIARTGPGGRDAVVAGKQVFATHYVNALLNLTAVVAGGDGSQHYLVVLNRSRVDVVHGLFGGLARMIIEHRLTSELSTILPGLARRLESGPPPPGTADAAGPRP